MKNERLLDQIQLKFAAFPLLIKNPFVSLGFDDNYGRLEDNEGEVL